MNKMVQFAVIGAFLVIAGLVMYDLLSQPEPEPIPMISVDAPLELDPEQVARELGTDWYNSEGEFFTVDEEFMLSTIYQNDYDNLVKKEDLVAIMNNMLFEDEVAKLFILEVATQISKSEAKVLTSDDVHNVMTLVYTAGEYIKVKEIEPEV